jgi:NAD(P)-dependent dehydrogenase (short-subunit alcohol dehydrogenase family)
MNIVVTGAGRGIGLEIIRQLCRLKGHSIVAVSRNISALQKLSNDIPFGKDSTSLYSVSIDLNKKGFEKELLTYISNRFTKVDLLINNAGTLINRSVQQLTAENFDTIFQVNVKAPFLIIKTLLPYFNDPSHIVNISSMGGIQGSEKFAGLSLYSASKGALAILSECMAVEFKDRGIRVNCIAPGSVQTEMFAEAFPGYKAQSSAPEMAKFIVDYALNGDKKHNGEIIPVTKTTP